MYTTLAKDWLNASKLIQEGIFWDDPSLYVNYYCAYNEMPTAYASKHFIGGSWVIKPVVLKSRHSKEWQKWNPELHPIEIRIYLDAIELVNGETRTIIQPRPVQR